jgi:hypothetical protein
VEVHVAILRTIIRGVLEPRRLDLSNPWFGTVYFCTRCRSGSQSLRIVPTTRIDHKSRNNRDNQRKAMRSNTGFLLLALPWVLFSTFAAHPTRAAEVYREPEVEVSAETNTNRDLRTTNEDSSESYALRWARQSESSHPGPFPSSIRAFAFRTIQTGGIPRTRKAVSISPAPSSRSVRISTCLPASSAATCITPSWQTALQRAESRSPTAPETGRIDGAGETRDSLRVAPTFRYQVSERFDLGLLGRTTRSITVRTHSPTGSTTITPALASIPRGASAKGWMCC